MIFPFTHVSVHFVWIFMVIVSVGASARAESLSGQYRGSLGTLELGLQGERVAGYVLQDGPCHSVVRRRVFEGQIQGDVLIGTVLLCQTGPACEEKVYSFLGWVYPADGTLVAQVRLDAGCQSPALDAQGRWTLEPAGAPRLKAKPNVRKLAELAKGELAKAQRLLEAGDYPGAVAHFEAGVSYADQNWGAFLGLGVAAMRMGNVHKALEAFERSRDLARASGMDHSDIHYNLACAQARTGDKRAAMESLRRSVKLGFSEPEAMSAEPDLQPLKEDAEFQSLVKKAAEPKGG